MNVLFVANDRTIFDATSRTRARMRSYAKEFGTLHILSAAPWSAKHEVDGTLVLHPMTLPRPIALLFMSARARSIIQRHGIDVVSAQDPFEQGRAALIATRGTTARLHIQVHVDFLSPWFTKGKGFRAMQVRVPFGNGIRQRIADSVLPHAEGIRVVSKRIKDSLIARYGARIKEPSVIPLTVSPHMPAAVALPSHDFTFALITVSRLEPEKRIEDILMAIGRLHPRYPSLGLFIVGSGSEEARLKALVRHLGLTTRVIFLGERHDAWGLMQSAQAYIQASAYEGYSRTLIEAALARLPIISTDVGIVGEVFRGYEDILSAPVADPAALAVHIAGLIEDHAARTALALNAERAAKEHMESAGELVTQVAADLSRTARKEYAPSI